MSKDQFEDLRDWGKVLETMEQMKRDVTLDSNQEGLLRILRYTRNWRLRESALECVALLRKPGGEIISEVLDILGDAKLYCDARILAANALGAMAVQWVKSNGRQAGGQVRQVLEKMRMLLDSPEPPVLHEAIRKSVAAIESIDAR